MPSMKIRNLLRHPANAVSAAAALACSSFVLATAAPASATIATCNSNTKNWAALYPTLTDWFYGEGATVCFGNKGANYPAYNSTNVFCAGNNSGVVTYLDLTTGAGPVSHTFWPDTSYIVVNGTYKQTVGANYADNIDVTEVQINGWSGSAGC